MTGSRIHTIDTTFEKKKLYVVETEYENNTEVYNVNNIETGEQVDQFSNIIEADLKALFLNQIVRIE